MGHARFDPGYNPHFNPNAPFVLVMDDHPVPGQRYVKQRMIPWLDNRPEEVFTVTAILDERDKQGYRKVRIVNDDGEIFEQAYIVWPK